MTLLKNLKNTEAEAVLIMKIKKILAVIILPICVFLHFAFNDYFDGCVVPLDDTKYKQEEHDKTKRRGI